MLEFLLYVRRIHVRLNMAFLPMLREKGFSPSELLILLKVFHSGYFRPTELAKQSGIPASTFSGLVDRLVNRGYLIREMDPDDRRSIIVKGTPELKEIMSEINAGSEAKLAEIFRNVPSELLEQTLGGLKQIYGLIGNEGCGEIHGDPINFM
jgi:DNA-binding MarR family transcriptional regulator